MTTRKQKTLLIQAVTVSLTAVANSQQLLLELLHEQTKSNNTTRPKPAASCKVIAMARVA